MITRYARYTLVAAAMGGALVIHLGPAGAQTTTPTPQPSATAGVTPVPTATVTPSARSLLAQSGKALKAVHWVHADGQLGATNRDGTLLRLRMTGDCNGKSFTYKKNGPLGFDVRVRMWVRGTVRQGGHTQRADAHLILIGSDRSSRAWQRSTSTRNVWQNIQSTKGNSVLFGTSNMIYICLPLVLGYVPKSAYTIPKSTQVKAMTWQGTPSWRLLQKGKQNNQNLTVTTYIDRSTLYLTRYSARTQDQQGNRSRIVLDYSRYGQAQTIKAPKIGSPTP